MRRSSNGTLARLGLAALLVTAAGAPACEGNAPPGKPGGQKNDCPASLATSPEGAAYVPPAEPATAVSASFEITIDPKDPSLSGDQREPQAAPLTLKTASGSLKISGGVKSFAKHPERLYLVLYLANDDKAGIRDAKVTVSDVSGSAAVYDFNADPWAAPTKETTFAIGGIAPEGVGRVILGFDASADMGPISFKLALAGTATARAAASSSPIVATPDGKEVWAVQADSDLVAVIDTASDERVAQVKTGGRPSSVAVTPDGKLVLVACAACNDVTVIDRAARQVKQVFTEADGVGREPRNIVVSPDGARAYVSAYVGDSVTAFERVGDAFRVVKEIPVGRRPVGMSVTPDGSTVLVAHYLPRGKVEDNGGWVSAIAADSLSVAHETDLRDDGNVTEAACLQKITGFDAYSAEDLSFEASPTQLAGVFLTPGGAESWVPGVRVAGFPILEGKVQNLGFQFLSLGANSPPMLFPLDTRDPRKAIWRKADSVIDVTDREEEFLRCVPFTEEAEAVTVFPTKDDPEELEYPGATIPSASIFLSETGPIRFMAFSRGGRRTLLLSYTADELAVMDTATHSPTSLRHLKLSGSSPIGMAVTPDGKKGYVAYESSMFASVLDLSAYAKDGALPEPEMVPYEFGKGSAPGQAAAIVTFRLLSRSVKGVPGAPDVKETGQVPLADSDPMDPVMRRGKVLFNASNPDKYPEMTGHRQAACAACHPNGGNDGTAWSTMEGERRTIGLWGGTGKRGWLHASATHRDITDFATAIVKERLGGTGLSPADVDALSRYVASGIPEIQRPKVDEALAAKGQAIFEKRCQSCHSGADHGSGKADSTTKYGSGPESGPDLYDVGSATDWAHVTLGEVFTNLFPPAAKDVLSKLRGDRDLGPSDHVEQVLEFDPRPERKRGQLKSPSLVNTWENVLYFHDGRVDSLADAVSDISKRTGGELTGDDLNAVVEYLKTL